MAPWLTQLGQVYGCWWSWPMEGCGVPPCTQVGPCTLVWSSMGWHLACWLLGCFSLQSISHGCQCWWLESTRCWVLESAQCWLGTKIAYKTWTLWSFVCNMKIWKHCVLQAPSNSHVTNKRQCWTLCAWEALIFLHQWHLVFGWPVGPWNEECGGSFFLCINERAKDGRRFYQLQLGREFPTSSEFPNKPHLPCFINSASIYDQQIF